MDKVDFEYRINDKTYNECFAKHLLAQVYDTSLKNSLNKDKPDIWNKQKTYGIEITTLTDTYYNTLNRCKRVWARRGFTLEQIVKNMPTILSKKLTINKYGNIILNNNDEDRRTISRSQTGISTTVAIKLRKLQSYQIFDKNDLFIFAPNLHGGCTPSKVQSALKNIEKHNGIKLVNFNHLYDNIIVYTYNQLWIFPFKEVGVTRVIEVDSAVRDYCNSKATKEAERSNKIKEEKKLKKLNKKNLQNQEQEME